MSTLTFGQKVERFQREIKRSIECSDEGLNLIIETVKKTQNPETFMTTIEKKLECDSKVKTVLIEALSKFDYVQRTYTAFDIFIRQTQAFNQVYQEIVKAWGNLTEEQKRNYKNKANQLNQFV